MSKKSKYAKRGALIIGVPFILWSLFIFIAVYSSNDPSLGAVVSWGIALPAVVLGFPWSLAAITLMAELPVAFKESGIYPALGFLGWCIIIIGPMINGALIGYRIGATDDKNIGAKDQLEENTKGSWAE